MQERSFGPLTSQFRCPIAKPPDRAYSNPKARRNVAIREVLDEWARCSAIVEPMIATFDPLMRAML